MADAADSSVTLPYGLVIVNYCTTGNNILIFVSEVKDGKESVFTDSRKINLSPIIVFFVTNGIVYIRKGNINFS